MKKKTAFLFLFVVSILYFIPLSHAEVIEFKSGKFIQGKVIAQTATEVKIDLGDEIRAYPLSEIETIDSKKPGSVYQTIYTQNSLTGEKTAAYHEIPQSQIEENMQIKKAFLPYAIGEYIILFLAFVSVFWYRKKAAYRIPVPVAIISCLFFWAALDVFCSLVFLKSISYVVSDSGPIIIFKFFLLALGFFQAIIGLNLLFLRDWARKVALFILIIGLLLKTMIFWAEKGGTNTLSLVVFISFALATFYYLALNKNYFRD